MDTCPFAKNLCGLISTLLATTMFEEESQSTLETLMALSNLSNKLKSGQGSSVNASILDYNEILNKIGAFSEKEERLVLEVSPEFLCGLLQKPCKSKNKRPK